MRVIVTMVVALLRIPDAQNMALGRQAAVLFSYRTGLPEPPSDKRDVGVTDESFLGLDTCDH